MVGQVVLNTKQTNSQVPDDSYFVSPEFTDNVARHQFSTIVGAMTYARAHMPTYPAKALILVYPGKYEETITDTHYRIHVQGVANTSYYMKGSVLYGTGVDSDNYPLKYYGGSVLNLINMTVEVDYGETFGEFANLRCDNCSFLGGHFIEYTGSDTRAMEIRHCVCDNDMFKLTGAQDGRFVAFRNCDLYGGTIDFGSTDTIGHRRSIKFERTICESILNIEGDWNINAYLSEMYGIGKFVFDTTGDIYFDKVILPNGLHFKSDPGGGKSIVDCNFVNPDVLSTYKDVTADVVITDVAYSGNTQQNGICECIQIRSPEKHVGGHTDCYYDLQSAVSSITGDGTVRIWEDLASLPEIVITNANTDINIDGQKKYSMAFTGDIVEVGADRKFGFTNVLQLTGGNVELNGNNAEISFVSCPDITGYLTLTNGAFSTLSKSSLYGATGHPAVSVDNITTPIIIGYSLVKGSTGNPAVYWAVDADGTFEGKFSTFVHGDAAGNSPFDHVLAGKVDISVYLSGLNSAWNPAKFTNLIGSAGVIIDPNITY